MVRDCFAYSAGLAGAELDGLSLLSLHLVVLAISGGFFFFVSAVHACESHSYLSLVYGLVRYASIGPWKVACICIRLFIPRILRQYDYLFSFDNRLSKISHNNISRSIDREFILQDQFSHLYHLFVAGAVLRNEGVDVADVELVSLGGAVVLDLLPGTVELLLLYCCKE